MTKKILVVEDELDNLKLVSHFLNQAGYEVFGAKDGIEATELLGHSRFDLVLSDLRMPGIDGLTLASHIVSSDPTTPVLLMTAYYFDNRADKATPMASVGMPQRCLQRHGDGCRTNVGDLHWSGRGGMSSGRSPRFTAEARGSGA